MRLRTEVDATSFEIPKVVATSLVGAPRSFVSLNGKPALKSASEMEPGTLISLHCEIIHWSNGAHTVSSLALQPARVVLLQKSIEYTG
jgi:hypothetical protein